jgi:hypothetical protein
MTHDEPEEIPASKTQSLKEFQKACDRLLRDRIPGYAARQDAHSQRMRTSQNNRHKKNATYTRTNHHDS